MSEDDRTVWCGNLSEKVTEDLLYELFLQAGPLETVRIPKSREGRQRNFGFVIFKHKCSVPYSIALFEGTCLYNKPLQLKSRNNTPLDIPLMEYGPKNSGGSERLRTQSLPMNFGNSGTSSPAVPDYNLLLQLGNQMLIPGTLGSPYPSGNQMLIPGTLGSPYPSQLYQSNSFSPGNSSPLYASQMNSSYYLGGQMTPNSRNDKVSKNNRDSHSHDRNRPYSRDGRNNSSNSHHYQHDRGHRGNSGRRY